MQAQPGDGRLTWSQSVLSRSVKTCPGFNIALLGVVEVHFEDIGANPKAMETKLADWRLTKSHKDSL